MSESYSKRGEGIVESSMESVCARIKDLARTWKNDMSYQFAPRDGAPDGVLHFYLVHEDFSFASPEEHVAFLHVLRATDKVINESNARIVEEPGSESYIEVEPRKGW